MTSATSLTVLINLDAASVTALANSGYKLYALHGVDITDGAALPVIWGAISGIAQMIQIGWDPAVMAYSSTAPVTNGSFISASTTVAASGGQTVSINASGVGSVTNTGPADEISFLNTVQNPFTIGLTRTNPSDADVPIFAVPLYGLGACQAYPSTRLLLNFSTRNFAPGTMVQTIEPVTSQSASYSQSILIDMAGASNRSVSFNINTGWEWGNYAWAQTVPATADLTKLLLGN